MALLASASLSVFAVTFHDKRSPFSTVLPAESVALALMKKFPQDPKRQPRQGRCGLFVCKSIDLDVTELAIFNRVVAVTAQV